jgi:ppGpp synthetase/RelA/SpoT-type nucleotidyltranferase
MPIEKLMKKYDDQQQYYETAFSDFKKFLEELLNNNNVDFQCMKSRIKSRESFKNKVRTLDTPKNLKGIDDLLGFRIIFYLSEEIWKFKNLLQTQGDIEIIRCKERFSEDDYCATHLFIDFQKNVFKFELQLTTALYDAWAHINHTCVYKTKTDYKKNDPKILENIKNYMKTTMKEHFHSAQLDLDLIVNQTDNLKNGQEILHVGLLEKLQTETNANTILDQIENIHTLLTQVGYKLPKKLNVLPTLKNIIEKAYTLDYFEHETLIGFLPKKTPENLIEKCLNVSNSIQIKFQYSEEFFDIIESILDNNKTDNQILKKAIEIGSSISKYKYHCLKQIGYQPQWFCLLRIDAWSASEKLKRLDFLIQIISNILDSEFGGSQLVEYDKLTWIQGTLTPSDTLAQIRAKSINIIFNMFSSCLDFVVRQKLLSTLKNATKLPRNYRDGLSNIIGSNIRNILNFYIDKTEGIELALMFEIHQQIDRVEIFFPKIFTTEIEKIKINLKNNETYQIFFIMYGYKKGTFLSMKYDEMNAHCNEKIKTYVEDISLNSLPKWVDIFNLILINHKNRFSEFDGFNELLYQLSFNKPNIGLILLKEYESLISPFIRTLIRGLWKSKEKNTLKKELLNLIKAKKYCQEIAWVLQRIDDYDAQMAQYIFSALKDSDDMPALNQLLASLLCSNNKTNSTKLLFNKVLSKLTHHGETGWIKYSWSKDSSVIESLDEKGISLIFKNLLMAPEIDYEIEHFLLPIAIKSPLSIIKFFRERINYKYSSAKIYILEYTAIPYSLDLLKASFNSNPEVLIPELLTWTSSNGEYFSLIHEAKQLLYIIFKNIPPILEQHIETLIEKGKIENVIDIVSTYGGTTSLHNVCKRIISQSKLTKNIKTQLFSLLSFPENKVLQGEYGRVNHYQSKIVEIQNWANDPNKKIRSFSSEYITFLNLEISIEQKTAYRRVELNKKEFKFNITKSDSAAESNQPV